MIGPLTSLTFKGCKIVICGWTYWLASAFKPPPLHAPQWFYHFSLIYVRKDQRRCVAAPPNRFPNDFFWPVFGRNQHLWQLAALRRIAQQQKMPLQASQPYIHIAWQICQKCDKMWRFIKAKHKHVTTTLWDEVQKLNVFVCRILKPDFSI